jgi:LytS/YehU family sensor histidine kinase
MLENLELGIEELISDQFGLAQADDAMERAVQSGVRKVLIQCNPHPDGNS